MLERRAGSCGENLEIRGPQMHKHTKLGKFVNPEKIRNFQKWRNDNNIINCHNGSGKKFSRSRVTKRTAPLDSSYEI